MQCPHCHAQIEDDSAFCPDCGQTIERPDSGQFSDDLDSSQTVMIDAGGGLEPGRQFAGRYRVEKELGEGGMGVVYQVVDELTQRTIALKVMRDGLLASSKALQRFLQEGALSRDLRHRNIVNVYDVATSAGHTYLTMERLEGRTLREFLAEMLERDIRVDLETAIAIIVQVLDGLQAAHQEGVIHRDLKPENIMLLGEPGSDGFRLKVLDFGIARAVQSSVQLTSSASSVGTPLYLAPEQMTASESAGPAADLYSVTAIFYELLTDIPPTGRWRLPREVRPELPAAVDHIIEKGLETSPRQRYSSVDALRSDLEALLAPPQPEPVPPRPEPRREEKADTPEERADVEESAQAGKEKPQPTPPEPGKPAKKRRWLWWLPITVVVLIGLAVGYEDIMWELGLDSAPEPIKWPSDPMPGSGFGDFKPPEPIPTPARSLAKKSGITLRVSNFLGPEQVSNQVVLTIGNITRTSSTSTGNEMDDMAFRFSRPGTYDFSISATAMFDHQFKPLHNHSGVGNGTVTLVRNGSFQLTWNYLYGYDPFRVELNSSDSF